MISSRESGAGPNGRFVLRAGLAAALLLLAAGVADAQQSRCADCHFASPDAPGHLYEWDRSPHGQNNVGCEQCHGGDATTFDLFPAHREILNASNPASPVNRRNIPRTCGTCHTGPFVAFQRSRHFALLQEGNQDVPVCTTCHSDVAAQLLAPRALEARCQTCHTGGGPGGEHPEFPAQGRALLEGVQQVRALLNEARPLIRRVRDAQLRQQLEEQYRQAEVPVIEAVEFGHSFSFDMSQERREVARQRAEALLERLANPTGP